MVAGKSGCQEGGATQLGINTDGEGGGRGGRSNARSGEARADVALYCVGSM